MNVLQVVELKKKDGSGTYYIVKDIEENEYLCFDPRIKQYSGTKLDNFTIKELNDGKKIINLSTPKQTSSNVRSTNKLREDTMILSYAKDIVTTYIEKDIIKSPTETTEGLKLFFEFMKELLNGNK